ncbi:MAG: hypothetical protein EPO11_01900 [Gammaproteobacteria bacterium]|nr:MAG: hypothetical protein EPO11_01900 [Gammaproteobacteria bacterium]
MARSILANSSSKLNLSHRQTEILEQLIMAGGQMAKSLEYLDSHFCLPAHAVKPAKRWAKLVMQFAKLLL